MRVGSLFSGIGGLEYGLERAGLVTSHEWMIEMDEYCCTVLRKNFKNCLIINDKVENINPRDLPGIDILTAGFPCQPVSVAGNQKGLNDERWLWDEVWRFVNDLRPRYFLVENVPGIFTANKGEAINRVLKDIAESGLYRFEWQVISARSVGGPHLRKRFFGVGTLGDSKHHGPLAGKDRGRLRQSSAPGRPNQKHEEDFNWELERKSQGDRELADSNDKGLQSIGGRGHDNESRSREGQLDGRGSRDDVGFDAASTKDEGLADSINSRQRARGLEVKRKGQKESKERRREQIIKSSRQGSGSVLVDSESKSGQQTNKSKGTKRKKQKARLDSRDGRGGTQQKTNRSEAQLWMGGTADGLPRWMARLGLVNVWIGNTQKFSTPITSSNRPSTKRILEGNNPKKNLAEDPKIYFEEGYDLWEYGMPRSKDEYPGRVDKLKALGNAVVPECAELVGRLIKRADELGTMVFDLSLLEEE